MENLTTFTIIYFFVVPTIFVLLDRGSRNSTISFGLSSFIVGLLFIGTLVGVGQTYYVYEPMQGIDFLVWVFILFILFNILNYTAIYRKFISKLSKLNFDIYRDENIASALIFVALLWFVMFVNGALDSSEPIMSKIRVLGVEHRRSGSYIKVEDTGGGMISATKYFYLECQDSKCPSLNMIKENSVFVELRYRKGALGLPWISSYEIKNSRNSL
ncbi:MAG: hypothetical protein R3A80_09905 [Bdellovibrionota bacterium]